MLHVAHSLQTLFELLACSPIYPSIPERQSMHVMLWGFDGSDGRSIFSEMSPALVAWLAHDFNEDLQMDVVHLMNKVRQHVCSEPQIRLRAQCFIVNDTLYLHTGLQASLCVQGRKSPVPGRGYELRSDHCDTLLDQFILFAALCRIDQHFYERY